MVAGKKKVFSTRTEGMLQGIEGKSLESFSGKEIMWGIECQLGLIQQETNADSAGE